MARYDVKLLGVKLSAGERAEYDDADRTVRDTRLKLIAAHFPSEPFGAFLHAVQEAAEDDDDPTVSDTARLYLKAFSRRIDVMSGAQAKLAAVDELAPVVQASHGALLFTRRVDVAEEMAAALRDRDVQAEAVHSGLTRRERQERLSYLRVGRLKALVAPTVLDEGIDVPTIDLAVVLGGSKSRRQMIQRMGRVLRLKPDGPKATFIVVYAQNTIEDLTANDGAEGCLDLIVEAADSVEHLDRVPPAIHVKRTPPPSPQNEPSPAPLGAKPVPTNGEEEKRVNALDAKSLPMTRRVLDAYRRSHGGSDTDAEMMLRRILADMQQGDATVRHVPGLDLLEARSQGFALVLGTDRFSDYRTVRADGATWSEVCAAATVAITPNGSTRVSVAESDGRDSRGTVRPPLARKPDAPVSNPQGQAITAIKPQIEDPPVAERASQAEELMSRLDRLVGLRQAGLLTEAEFSAAKAKILF